MRKPKYHKSLGGQICADFSLPPKLNAIGRLKIPPLIRKLLTALATMGCADPTNVVLGEGGEDGEWLIAPRRTQLANAGQASVSAFKRWRKALEQFPNPFVQLDKASCEAHSFLVNWAAVFYAVDHPQVKWTGVHFEPTTEMDRGPFLPGEGVHGGPGSEVDRVRNGPGEGVHGGPGCGFPDGDFPGEESASSYVQGDLKPTNKETKEFKDHQPEPNQPASAPPVRTMPRSLGITIQRSDLRGPLGMLKIFHAAVRVGAVNARDVREVFAFLHHVDQAPPTGKGSMSDKCGIVVACLCRLNGNNWTGRARSENYRRADELIALIASANSASAVSPQFAFPVES